jgi:hypothetical protein
LTVTTPFRLVTSGGHAPNNTGVGRGRSRPEYTEFFHVGMQSRRFEPQPCRRALRTADTPSCGFERVENDPALRLVEPDRVAVWPVAGRLHIFLL